jgi:Leucine-rich repeat (LRR) protein
MLDAFRYLRFLKMRHVMIGRWNLMASACIAGALTLSGCPSPSNSNSGSNSATNTKPAQPAAEDKADPAPAATPKVAVGTAKPEDVATAKKRLTEIGAGAKFVEKAGMLSEIAIQDGANVTTDDMILFGKLTDLQKLQILNCRALNDEMAAHLLGLKQLTGLAITNSIISDASVEAIVKSFPNLTDLDLSSNTNMTNQILKLLVDLKKLQRLTLVQNRFNELNTRQLAKMPELRAIDLRGNMDAGDMTLEIVSKLPKLTALKHRSNVISDSGMEYLSNATELDSLLIQDFKITSQSGMHLAKLKKLTQLEIFRCQAFGSEGVLALKGLGLQRLTLRDLPDVNDQATEVFTDLPKLMKLYLHELGSLSDEGLKNLAALQSLELLDIWSISAMSDATVEVIAKLPNLKELGIRSTSITDASIDKLLAMPKLQSLTLKDNASVSAEGVKKLSSRKWTKLDTGNGSSETE